MSNFLLRLWPAYALILGTVTLGVLAGVLAALLLTLRDLAHGRSAEDCARDWPDWLSR